MNDLSTRIQITTIEQRLTDSLRIFNVPIMRLALDIQALWTDNQQYGTSIGIAAHAIDGVTDSSIKW